MSAPLTPLRDELRKKAYSAMQFYVSNNNIKFKHPQHVAEAMCMFSDQQTAALREELEGWKDRSILAEAELEEVKKDRDEAFDLLDTYNHLWTEPEYDKWNLLRQALLSSLENKHEFGIMQPGEPGAGGYDPNNPPPQIVYCHKCNNQLLEVIEYKKVNYCKNCGHQVLGESIQNNNI